MDILGTLVRGVLLATAVVIGARLIVFLVPRKTPGPLPPGPKGLPFVGNIRDLPTHGGREWEHWLKLKDTYGPISSVSALGKTLVILHSPELALELYDKKSSIYSSRTTFVFADYAGWTALMPILPYDKVHRYHRKLAHVMIGTERTIAPYTELQEVETHRFLLRVLEKPEGFLDHIRTNAGAIILKMVYGYTVERDGPDPLVELVDKALDNFAASTVPGSWFVDLIPALQYVPEWMPGTGWKKTGREFRKTMIKTVETPLRFARRKIAEGTAARSFISDFHKEKGDDLSQDDGVALKLVALAMYGGGADTTVTTISAFYLAMTLFPEVQRRAREEIDRVVGTDRLPALSDRANLPYIDAVVTEAWRWHPVTPMGVAHSTTADDVVMGYHIPKGAIVMSNVWWFLHDPTIYPDPNIFDPNRYLGAHPAPDPAIHAFGWGRRICPGRYFAVSSVWLAVARSLAVFEISKARDAAGQEIEPPVSFSPGIISRVAPFGATIRPRSERHEALIRRVEVTHPWEKGNADELEDVLA